MGAKNVEPLTRIVGEGHVAAKYGLEEAIFLDSIIYWWRTNRDNERNLKEGRWWTYNTLKTYMSRFPWWTEAQIRRIIARCKDKGALLTGNFNEDQRDRTVWYSPSDELLALYGESAPCICENQQMDGAKPQMDVPESADTSDGNSAALPCNYRGSTNPPYSPPTGDGDGGKPSADERGEGELSQARYKPEWFNIFYKLYPRHEGRKDAIKAWDKLKPSLELCKVMETAIRKARESPKWQEEGGRYIPHASSWLNGRRWEDEIQPAAPESSGGWAEDPEEYE